jgi:hypothetical protein
MIEIATARLQLRALPREQLIEYLDQPKQLERALGISLSRPILTETTHRALNMKVQKMAAAAPKDHPWYTYWLIVIRQDA